MREIFSSEFFAGNRRKLRQLFAGTAPIVLAGNGLLQRGGDGTYQFSQDASFWYLTGVDQPDVTLVMDRDKEYLIVPARSSVRQTFDGSVDVADLQKRSGIAAVVDEVEGRRLLLARLKRAKHVATLAAAPPYVESLGFYSNPARGRLAEMLHELNPNLALLDLSKHLMQLRAVKQPPELRAIQSAIDITIETLKSVIKPAKLRGYSYEYEIEADISRGFRCRGASGHAFEPIVAGGKRATTLHNVANNGRLAAGELVVMDVGAEVDHYAADITRTVALGGRPGKRQREVYDAVASVQDYAKTLLGPGVIIKDYEAKIAQFMGEKLRSLGLIKSITRAGVRRYYPHATSHFMGLNVHDTGDYAQPLKPGMVLTVEPGIYIAKEGIGVRIEDDVLITENGINVLSGDLPRTL